MKLIFRPEAEEDLLKAFKWYEEKRSGLGSEFLDEVSLCQQAVEQRPLSFALVHDTARRAMTHRFPYALFFVVGPDVISVVAVFYMAGNPEALPRRLASVAEQTHAASREP